MGNAGSNPNRGCYQKGKLIFNKTAIVSEQQGYQFNIFASVEAISPHYFTLR